MFVIAMEHVTAKRFKMVVVFAVAMGKVVLVVPIPKLAISIQPQLPQTLLLVISLAVLVMVTKIHVNLTVNLMMVCFTLLVLVVVHPRLAVGRVIAKMLTLVPLCVLQSMRPHTRHAENVVHLENVQSKAGVNAVSTRKVTAHLRLRVNVLKKMELIVEGRVVEPKCLINAKFVEGMALLVTILYALSMIAAAYVAAP
jgi:hypothetical protein